MNIRKTISYLLLLTSLLYSSSLMSQSLVGRWKLRESYLKIDYSQKLKFLNVKTSKIGFKDVDKSLFIDFYEDGSSNFGGEAATHMRDGNTLIFDTRDSEVSKFEYSLNGKNLTLWMRNEAMGLSKQEAKLKAIRLAKQMGMYEQFTGLAETEDIYQIRIGFAYDYVGNAPTREQDARRHSKKTWNRQQESSVEIKEACIVTDREFAAILEKAQNLNFDDEKLSYMSSAIKSKKCFKTSQIRQMIELLTFDKDKLPLLRTGYANVIDKDNYFDLEDTLDFMDSKRQFKSMLK